MSVAPDPGKILELISWLDEDFQTRPSFDSLLQQITRYLPKIWSSIDEARAYRPDGSRLRLVVNSGAAADEDMLEASHPFVQALADRQPVYDARDALWGVPLTAGSQVIGLMAVKMADTEPEAEAWLQLLSTLLAQALAPYAALPSSHATADNLVLSSHLIAAAEDYAGMAQAVMYTLAQDMAGVAITIFDTPLDEDAYPARRAVVAMSVSDGPLEIDDPTYTGDLPEDEQLRHLWRGLPVFLDDPLNSRFALAARHYMAVKESHPLAWTAVFGLRAGGQMLGTLEVLHRASRSLNPEEIDAYNTLADQIGVSVRNHQLLQQMSESLDETRQLYELNRQMLVAQDNLEVLRALRILAPDASMITHSALEYDAQQKLVDLILRHLITADSERVVAQSAVGVAGPQALAQMGQYLPTWYNPVMIEDTAHPPSGVPAVLVESMRQQGAASMVMVPIRQRSQVTDLVRVIFPTARRFDDRARRLYNAVRDQMSIVFQVQRSLEDAQRGTLVLGKQVTVLQTLNDLSTVISMARDESQLLNQSAQALVTALNVDYCQIFMLDAAQETATVLSEYPHRGGTGVTLQVADIPVLPVLDQNNPTPVVVNDPHNDPRIQEGGREVLDAEGIRALLVLPLFVRGVVSGGIRLDILRQERRFTTEMTEIAQTILSQVVVGLQNIRLLDESQRRSEQLQRVNQFGQILQSTLDMSAILETALTESHQIIPTDRMMIALHDPSADVLRTVGLYANKENYLTPVNGAVVELEGTFAGQVWRERQLLHVPDIVRAGDISADDVRELRSLLVMPLVGRSGLLGVISVGHGQAYMYSDADIIVFQQMVGLLAAAVENAGAYQGSQRLARNEALVNEIATRLQQQVELEDMLHIVANDLGQALGARRARIRLGTQAAE